MGLLTSATSASCWAVIVLATGTAFFKPVHPGSLAQNLTKKNSSLGWGIFYWVVNVGAASGPAAGQLRAHRPRLAGAVLHRRRHHEPELPDAVHLQGLASGADKTEGPLQVLMRTLRNLGDARLVTWLLIMSCFWLMMYSLWDLQPNFITDWNDSGDVARLIQSVPLPARRAGRWKPTAACRCPRNC